MALEKATSGCLGNTPNADALLAKSDAEAGNGAVHIEVDTPPKRERSRLFSPALITSMVLTSMLGVAGFIMAAWATHQLKTANQTTFALTSAILVTSPSEGPNGYTTLVNMFRGTGYWAGRRNMPYYRSDHAAVTWNNTAYLVGGQGTDATSGAKFVLNRTVAYDAVYNQYTQLPDMPEPRCRFGYGVVGNFLYVFGGYNSAADFAPSVDTMLVYNFVTQQWTTSPVKMTAPRSDMCQGVINNKIYVTGGYDNNGATIKTVEVFDPATNQWSTTPAKLNTDRGDCGAVAVNNQLYVLGGTQYAPPVGVNCSDTWWLCYQFLNSVERVDPSTNTVTQLANMRMARADFGIVESDAGASILVAGGEHSDLSLGVSRLLAQPWVEEYSIADNYWTPKSPLPDGRFRLAMTKAGNQLLAFGGQPSCPSVTQTDDAECYRNGLNTLQAFTDVQYPNVYLMTRNQGTTPADVL